MLMNNKYLCSVRGSSLYLINGVFCTLSWDLWLNLNLTCLCTAKKNNSARTLRHRFHCYIISIDFEGCLIHPIRKGASKWWRFVRRPVTVCQFAICRWSCVVLHTYTNLCGIFISLEREILLHFFRLFICVLCGASLRVTNHQPFSRAVSDRVYGPRFKIQDSLFCTIYVINYY